MTVSILKAILHLYIQRTKVFSPPPQYRKFNLSKGYILFCTFIAYVIDMIVNGYSLMELVNIEFD